MRKKRRTWRGALWAGLCMALLVLEGRPVVQAKEQGAGQKGILQMREPASRGNLIYRGGGKEAGIYESDFSLLWDRLSAVSGEVFDPAEYTHMHRWEYRDEDDRTHTRYCVLCGDTLTDMHKAESEEDCMISDGEKEYPGIRYQCVCGYQWKREKAHVPVFDIVDENCHRSRCLLDGTEYCPGYEPVEEEHYAFSFTPDPSGTHDIKTCIDCGYQTEEESEITDGETNEIEPDEPTAPETDGAEPDEPSVSEPEEAPEVSVSGNDCVEDEEQNGTEDKAKKTADEEEEKL